MPTRRRAAVGAALVLGLLLAADAIASGGREHKIETRLEHHPTRLIVRLKRGIAAGRLAASSGLGRRVRELGSMRAASLHLMEVAEKDGDMEEILEELNASPLVEYAEPDYVVHPLGIPNDSDFDALWGLHQQSDADIDAPEAWDITEGDPDIVVAVVDTGIDYDHPDLAANMWRNPGEVENGLDDDGNGYVDDIHGIDCIAGTGDPRDDDGHGTHVAGTIGAVGNNGIGVVGVSPRVQLMALRFLGSSGGYISDAIECLSYAVEMKRARGVNLRVTNNSWGGGGFSQALRDAIASLDEADVLFVAAAGNAGRDNDSRPQYPSSFEVPNVVAVAASGEDDQLATFSNYGAYGVDLAAPGVGILSTTPHGSYAKLSGTSMAAPHVSGAAALVAAHLPGASAARLKSVLLDYVDPVAGLRERLATGGRLNAARALCSPGDLVMGVEPRDGFLAGTGVSTTLRVWLRDCGIPVPGAFVRVRSGDGNPELILADDGGAPDEAAGDGVYAATWRARTPGSVRLDVKAILPGAVLNDAISGTVVETTPYAVSDHIPFDWVDARSGSEIKHWSDDSDKGLPIGFDFFFYETIHRKVRISSNGYLTFAGSGRQYANLPLPSSFAPAFLIAPYWDDLEPGAKGRVFYLREGSAPDRRLTIQWDGFSFYQGTGLVTFQVTLHELDGRIVLRYLDVSTGDPVRVRGASATIGIQDGGGNFAAQYSTDQATLADGLAIEFRVDEAAIPHTSSPVAGRSLRIQDVGGEPEKRRLELILRDASIAAPGIGTASDPSRWGARLRIRNPATMEEAALDLPAEGWKASKHGYRFRGTGPCRRVAVRKGSIRARCRGSQIDFSLAEPQQGSLSLSLELGSKTSLCALFGGNVKSDYGIGYGSRHARGDFAAEDAPPPASCPLD